MTPYTLTITGEESSKVYRALKAGLFAARQQASIHVVGAEQIVRQIEDALEIMNRPCEGGFETDKERSSARMKDFEEQCAKHGND